MIHYDVIADANIENFIASVNQYLNDEWGPVGGKTGSTGSIFSPGWSLIADTPL
jgi:hypothetical protein